MDLIRRAGELPNERRKKLRIWATAIFIILETILLIVALAVAGERPERRPVFDSIFGLTHNILLPVTLFIQHIFRTDKMRERERKLCWKIINGCCAVIFILLVGTFLELVLTRMLIDRIGLGLYTALIIYYIVDVMRPTRREKPVSL
jgi:cobalamin biosynthesis protein CobD/CbiB